MCRQTRDSAHQLVILYNPVLCVETLLEPSLYYKLCINYTININQKKCHDLYNNNSFWPSFLSFENIIHKWCVLSEIGYLEFGKNAFIWIVLNCSIHFNCSHKVNSRNNGLREQGRHCPIWQVWQGWRHLFLLPYDKFFGHFFLFFAPMSPDFAHCVTCFWNIQNHRYGNCHTCHTGVAASERYGRCLHSYSPAPPLLKL